MLLFLALPAIFITDYLWFGMQMYASRWTAQGSVLLAPVAILIVVASYFIIDRRWTKENIGRTIIRSVVIFLAVTIGLAIEIPSGVTVGQRFRQKETLKRMRAIASVLDAERVRHGRYPDVDDVAALAGDLPRDDAWSHSFALHSRANSYVLISYGLDGLPDVRSPADYQAAPTTRFEDDIVLHDGHFVRFPEGLQP